MSEDRKASLEPPVEIKVASTPTLDASRTTASVSPALGTTTMQGSQDPPERVRLMSPLVDSSGSEIDTPPASQRQTPPRRHSKGSDPFPASPPSSIARNLRAAYGASNNLPTARDLDEASEEKLRNIAKDLLSVAQENRMSAAHFKLQHSLLTMTSGEAVKKAEVEQQLARREVEILQSAEYRNRHQSPKPPSDSEDQLTAALRHIKDLQDINFTLERRLRHAKKLIEEENQKSEHLLEENHRLKKRIRDNREHFTQMLDKSPLPSSSPFSPQHQNTGRYSDSDHRPLVNTRIGSHDPLAALIGAANQASQEDAHANGQSHSQPTFQPQVPAHLQQRNHPQRHPHTRGALSLSSLSATPSRPGATTNAPPTNYATPMNKRENDPRFSYSMPRHAAPTPAPALSTSHGFSNHPHHSLSQVHAEHHHPEPGEALSAETDVEEAVTDEDVPTSHASPMASNVIQRHESNSSNEYQHEHQHGQHDQHDQSDRHSHLQLPPPVPVPQQVKSTSTLLQSTLFGHVRKSGVSASDQSAGVKRKASYGDQKKSSPKRAKEGTGLGARG